MCYRWESIRSPGAAKGLPVSVSGSATSTKRTRQTGRRRSCPFPAVATEKTRPAIDAASAIHDAISFKRRGPTAARKATSAKTTQPVTATVSTIAVAACATTAPQHTAPRIHAATRTTLARVAARPRASHCREAIAEQSSTQAEGGWRAPQAGAARQARARLPQGQRRQRPAWADHRREGPGAVERRGRELSG